MKIAVTYENGLIFQHFGHTSQFKIYTVEDNQVQESHILDSNGAGHGALATLLQDEKIDTLICGGIGAGAQNALAQVGVTLYGGVQGEADKAVNDFIEDMKKKAGGDSGVTSKAYRTLDIDALLIKSRNISEFKTCIRELDEYWKSVYEASVNTEKENERLRSHKADPNELQEARDANNRLETRIRELERENRHLTLACRYMRKMLKKYLYPSVANELLKQEKIPVSTVCV